MGKNECWGGGWWVIKEFLPPIFVWGLTMFLVKQDFGNMDMALAYGIEKWL